MTSVRVYEYYVSYVVYEKRIIKKNDASGRFALTMKKKRVSRRAVFVAGGDVRVRAQVVVFVRRGRGRGSFDRVFDRRAFRPLALVAFDSDST